MLVLLLGRWSKCQQSLVMTNLWGVWAIKLSLLIFSVVTFLLTENPLSTVGCPWDSKSNIWTTAHKSENSFQSANVEYISSSNLFFEGTNALNDSVIANNVIQKLSIFSNYSVTFILMNPASFTQNYQDSGQFNYTMPCLSLTASA